jgi:hypothetical protein
MFSAPMAGRTDAQIDETRARAKALLEANGYEFVNTVFGDEPEWSTEALKAEGIQNIPLAYLAGSLRNLAKCDAILMMKGWEHARGCLIEFQAARAYGVRILYEEDLTNAE